MAAGSSDFCVRIFSAAVKEVEKKPEKTVWGDKIAFGSILAEFKNPNDGWVHSVSFAPSGNRLAWVSHDSTVSVADCTSGTPVTVLIRLNLLPFKSCVFLSEDTIVAAGHNNSPYKFKFDGSAITLVGDIDTGPSKTTSSENVSAMSRFKNMDTLAQSKGVETAAATKTHANTVTYKNVNLDLCVYYPMLNWLHLDWIRRLSSGKRSKSSIVIISLLFLF